MAPAVSSSPSASGEIRTRGCLPLTRRCIMLATRLRTNPSANTTINGARKSLASDPVTEPALSSHLTVGLNDGSDSKQELDMSLIWGAVKRNSRRRRTVTDHRFGMCSPNRICDPNSLVYEPPPMTVQFPTLHSAVGFGFGMPVPIGKSADNA